MNISIKSVGWFLCNSDLRHERVRVFPIVNLNFTVVAVVAHAFKRMSFNSL